MNKKPLSRVLSPNPLTYPRWKAGAGGRRDCLILCQASPLSHTLVPTASHHRGLLPLPSCRTTKYDRPSVPDAEVVRMRALNQGLNGTGGSEDSSCPKREPWDTLEPQSHPVYPGQGFHLPLLESWIFLQATKDIKLD